MYTRAPKRGLHLQSAFLGSCLATLPLSPHILLLHMSFASSTWILINSNPSPTCMLTCPGRSGISGTHLFQG